MKTKGAALLAAAAMLTAGCSSDEPTAQDSTSRPGGSSSTSSSSSSETTPEVSSSTTTVPWTLGEFAANEYQKTRPSKVEKAESAYSQLSSDQQWWKVMIETCALAEDEGGNTVTTGWLPWGIIGDDGGSYPASNTTWGDFPRPEYPVGEDPIPVGSCRKGWVMVAVNDGVQPKEVSYTPSGVSGTSWVIP